MKPINERFKLIVDRESNGNSSEYQRIMGFGSSETIRTYYVGKKLPSSQILLRTLEVFPTYSAEWLMRGEGDMLKYKSAELSEYLIDLLEAADLDTIKSFVKDLVNEKSGRYETKKKQLDEDRPGKSDD